MSISSIAILPGAKSWFIQFLPGSATESGWRHLSLPIEMVPAQDLLSGWEAFSCGEYADRESRGEIIVACDLEDIQPVADVSISRLQLAGYLDRELDTVYCFFDLENKRWFRLSCGHTDPVSEVTMEASPVGPMVVDTRHSVSYRIDRDSDRLIRLEEREDTDENQ